VRLEDPVALADWALAGDGGWDAERIERALARPEPTWVRLPAPIALAVSYATASADPDGTEHFTDDRYGLDAALDRLLAARARPGSGPAAGAAAGGAPPLSAPRAR
jgi:murein L,D-transpeptidase YcbB/YkuD